MREELKRQGFEGDHVTTERMLNMRFEGTDTALMVLPSKRDGDGQEDFEAAFKRVYKAEFGFLLETKTIIVDDIKVSLCFATLVWILVDGGRARFAVSGRPSIALENRCSRK